MKSPPFSASRTALVATATICSHCRRCASSQNRRNVTIARSIASYDSRCDGNDIRPSPTISFIRQSVVSPPSPSAWAMTMWMLFEPTSMAASRSSPAEVVVFTSGSVESRCDIIDHLHFDRQSGSLKLPAMSVNCRHDRLALSGSTRQQGPPGQVPNQRYRPVRVEAGQRAANYRKPPAPRQPSAGAVCRGPTSAL